MQLFRWLKAGALWASCMKAGSAREITGKAMPGWHDLRAEQTRYVQTVALPRLAGGQLRTIHSTSGQTKARSLGGPLSSRISLGSFRRAFGRPRHPHACLNILRSLTTEPVTRASSMDLLLIQARPIEAIVVYRGSGRVHRSAQ